MKLLALILTIGLFLPALGTQADSTAASTPPAKEPPAKPLPNKNKKKLAKKPIKTLSLSMGSVVTWGIYGLGVGYSFPLFGLNFIAEGFFGTGNLTGNSDQGKASALASGVGGGIGLNFDLFTYQRKFVAFSSLELGAVALSGKIKDDISDGPGTSTSRIYESTYSTNGLGLFLGIGANYLFSDSLLFGFRLANIFLPFVQNIEITQNDEFAARSGAEFIKSKAFAINPTPTFTVGYRF